MSFSVIHNSCKERNVSPRLHIAGQVTIPTGTGMASAGMHGGYQSDGDSAGQGANLCPHFLHLGKREAVDDFAALAGHIPSH